MKTFWIGMGVVLALLFSAQVFCSVRDGGLCFECMTFQSHRHGATERPAATTLKTLATAQADFRANDRDGDKICQFWRADVAGLYVLVPKGGEAIKLIELSMAAADDRPRTEIQKYAVKSAKAGYWFRAIPHVDEDSKAPDPDRFAFCAFPDSPAAGKYLFIVDETNTIYRSEAKGRRGIEVFPDDAELRTQWSKVD